MTDTPAPSSTNERDALRARIDAAERRNAERSLAEQARAAADAAVDYTRAHPLTVIGGAVALGLAIGLLTRPGRRVAGRALHSAGGAISGAASSASSGVKSITTRGGSRIGQKIGEAAVAYALTMIDELIEAAREGKDRAGEFGEAAGTQARKLSADATNTAGAAADHTRAFVSKAREAALDVVRDLRRPNGG